MPRLISSPRIKKTFSAPADATAAQGTSRVMISRALGDNRFSRGTSEFSPTATVHDALTARRYDWIRVCVDRALDLLELALLIATLRDWFVTCQAMVPGVYRLLVRLKSPEGETYLQARRKHTGRDNQIRDNKTGHAKGEEDGLSGIRMEGRVHDLLRLPYLRCHRLQPSLLEGGYELFGMFEAGRADE